jgi:ABC-2 type transport system ATP-binding protein
VTAARLGWWTGTVVLALAVAPTVDPLLDEPGAAVPLGICAGAALFAVLARRGISPAALVAVPRDRLIARTVVLTVKAAHEEAVWRAVVLGFLVGPIGRAGALAVSTCLFAAAHVNRLGARAVQHLATGVVFGLAYLATGRLAAAIGAHAAYNVLIGIGRLSVPDLSVPATGGQAQTTVRSRGPSRPTACRAVSRPAVPSPSVASLVAVSKTFGKVRALDRLDLRLREGEVLGLLGPNGAGKSTAISILLGLRRPDEGRAELFGRDPRETAARRRIGVVLQEVSLPPVLRVGELVELVRAHYRDPVPRDELLERLDLGNVARAQIGGLSGGQRRRLAMALALAGRPKALFLDEPTAAIDAGGRRVLWRELNAFAVAGGAILLTTQQLEEAQRYATRLVVISHGRIVGQGTVGEIRARVGKATIRLRAEQLPPLPGATLVESTLDRHVVQVDDPERYVAGLVRSGISYRDLEVARPSLEDAFVALTEDES